MQRSSANTETVRAIDAMQFRNSGEEIDPTFDQWAKKLKLAELSVEQLFEP